MKTPVFFGLMAIFFVLASTAKADIEYWKVVEVTGQAEMKPPTESAWKDLSAPLYIKSGSLVRTGKDGSVDFCLNRQWDSFLRLNENSEITFLQKSPKEIRLKNGSLFALLEGEPAVGSLGIFLPDMTVRMTLGGAAIFVSTEQTTLQVFGESVEVTDLTGSASDVSQNVAEGWEWSASRTRRLDFSDYAQWQRWFRKSYERKDKFLLKHTR